MIDIEYIRSFFPPAIARESRFDRYMLKEYLQLLILDHLTTTPYIGKMAFIGGTPWSCASIFNNSRSSRCPVSPRLKSICGK